MGKKYHLENAADAENINHLASKRLTRNVNRLHDEHLTLGDRLADRVAELAGSWVFIISFIVILFIWIVFNSLQLLFHSFDPFPFILLNLVLSCIAALQAPVIMMSQNRQEEKDRLRAEHDYQINLKSEILIEHVLNHLDKLEADQKTLGVMQQQILQALAGKDKEVYK